ncbi:VWA domain-containing protein [Fictibacillus phosphorivorans]|uniref:VWA domain-containing protein n=1 Tax=Fictibacillus phosphorivorans TaxID=1221500 RepID=UPI00203EE96C|nr:VWA domain-containing protein [Fictibacillus phosphorivorans]MCM3719041.1 VWA domain-containing protein [Fictibacillus phosphorivorans]MCM3776663.1 VWA domain-containing protein [Fictibacillus phosphorivorans]
MNNNIKMVVVLLFLSIAMLAGCSEKKDKALEKEINKKTEKTQEKIQPEKVPKAPRELEDMIKQKPGVLIEKYMDPKLEGLYGWAGYDYINYYRDEFKPIAEKEIKSYFQKNKDLSSQEIYDYLVYQLGSGQYASYYEQLLSYGHGYEMPELPTSPEEIEEEKKHKKPNVVILVDASGSMKAEVDGGVKMDLAKETIKKFTSDLPDDTNVSLFAYGHQGSGDDSDKARSCEGIEEVYPLTSYEEAAFDESLESFDASGWTPLAGAINKANDLLSQFPESEYENIVYIVSDGMETCGGDPVAAAKKLTDKNIEAKLNIIGFDVDDKGQQQLMKVANAGKGKYASVRDQASLEEQVLKKWRPSIGELVWTQGVSAQDYIDAQKRMSDIYNPLFHISTNEGNRIRNAVYYLQQNNLIPRDKGNEVIEQAEASTNLRNEHFKKIKEEKMDEAERLQQEIDSKVEAWKQQWRDEISEK